MKSRCTKGCSHISHCFFQSLSPVQFFLTPWTAALHISLYFIISCSLLKLMSIVLMMPPNYLTLCHLLLLVPSVFSRIRVFCNELALRVVWPKYGSFSISPSKECSGSISFRTDWFDLLAVQGILKSLLEHHSSKASILSHIASYGLTLTSIHNNWKNHSFDYMDLCPQDNVCTF